MRADQRKQLKRLFRVHVDPRGSAPYVRLLRRVARAIGVVARFTGRGRPRP